MSIPGLGGTEPGNVMPSISVGAIVGMPLLPTVTDKLVRVVVDTHLHLPGMFEIWFNDQEGTAVDDSGLKIGAVVTIDGAKFGETSTTTLIKGEVTSIEAVCESLSILTVVRGYEKSHRLQRARRSRTFVNSTDSDIAKKVAVGAGLSVGTITSTSVTYQHMSQVAQTDWEFLQERAREIGYEITFDEDKFNFKPAASMPASGGLGGALAAAASAVASALGLGSALEFKKNLVTFYPRLSAANITPDVEVRVWDPETSKVVSSKADVKTTGATISGQDPKKLANSFTGGLLPIPSLPAMPSIPGLEIPGLGASSPSNTAFVVVDHPFGSGSSANSAVEQAAKNLADQVSSTFAEAEGEAFGDPSIVAGEQVDIKGVPEVFCGKWTITQARHIFDPEELGYRVHFTASGRSDRSLFGLSSGGGGATGRRAGFDGVVCGVVSNAKDPKKFGRVKLHLPWLSPDYETDWARVAQPGAGASTGALFLPSVGDEVLVGFEFGDPRRPYVIGGLLNKSSKFALAGSAVSSGGDITMRGLETPAGNLLRFSDEVPPAFKKGSVPPTKSEIMLGTFDEGLALTIDQSAGTIKLVCKPKPPASKTPAGTVTIDCSGTGKIEIKGGAGGVKIESEGQLELSGKAGVKIDSTALVQIKGQMVQLN